MLRSGGGGRGELGRCRKIGLFGAKIERNESVASRPIVSIDLAGSDRFGDTYVSLLKSFVNLEGLNFAGTGLTDAGLMIPASG
jgi:hypothetical protein